jgi:hypothetical protein
VLCLHFPELLTTAELRAVYPMHWVRALVAFPAQLVWPFARD